MCNNRHSCLRSDAFVDFTNGKISNIVPNKIARGKKNRKRRRTARRKPKSYGVVNLVDAILLLAPSLFTLLSKVNYSSRHTISFVLQARSTFRCHLSEDCVYTAKHSVARQTICRYIDAYSWKNLTSSI